MHLLFCQSEFRNVTIRDLQKRVPRYEKRYGGIFDEIRIGFFTFIYYRICIRSITIIQPKACV